MDPLPPLLVVLVFPYPALYIGRSKAKSHPLDVGKPLQSTRFSLASSFSNHFSISAKHHGFRPRKGTTPGTVPQQIRTN